MKRRPRTYYTETNKALTWDRWQKGECSNSSDDKSGITTYQTTSHIAVDRQLFCTKAPWCLRKCDTRADTLGHRWLYPTLDTVHRVRLRIAPAGSNRSFHKTSFPLYLTSDTLSPNPIRIATENSPVAQQRKSRMLRRVFGDTLNSDNGLRPRYHHQRHIESCRKGTPLRSPIFSYCHQTTNYLVEVPHIIPCSIEVSSRQTVTSPSLAEVFGCAI